MDQLRPVLLIARSILQSVSLALITVAALTATLFAALAALGVVPWLELPLSLNGVAIEQGGLYVQLAVTAVLLCMCFFLPTNYRIMQLESAHHGFSIRMEDVTRAYAAVHAADRKGLFQATSEFDAVKERILHLRNHPDLGSLEPDILEVAAQMSRVSQDMAETYADDRVERAYDFLRQRQHEIDSFQERLDHAKALHADIRQWATRLEMDEAVAQSQLDRMIEDLEETLPDLQIARRAGRQEDAEPSGVLRLAAE